MFALQSCPPHPSHPVPPSCSASLWVSPNSLANTNDSGVTAEQSHMNKYTEESRSRGRLTHRHFKQLNCLSSNYHPMVTCSSVLSERPEESDKIIGWQPSPYEQVTALSSPPDRLDTDWTKRGLKLQPSRAQPRLQITEVRASLLTKARIPN